MVNSWGCPNNCYGEASSLSLPLLLKTCINHLEDHRFAVIKVLGLLNNCDKGHI